MIGSSSLSIPDFPGGASGKESTCQCRRCKRCGFDPWVGKIPWNRKWQPTLVFLPGKSHEQRSLVGYSPWDHKESDTSEHACTLYTIMSCRFYRSLHWHEWFGSEPMLFLQALKQPYPFQTILSLVWCSDLPVVLCHSWASLGSLSTQQRGFKFLLIFKNVIWNQSLLKSLQWFPIAHRLK